MSSFADAWDGAASPLPTLCTRGLESQGAALRPLDGGAFRHGRIARAGERLRGGAAFPPPTAASMAAARRQEKRGRKKIRGVAVGFAPELQLLATADGHRGGRRCRVQEKGG
jgi:hypothetical protein